jgi:hypothetical protein
MSNQPESRIPILIAAGHAGNPARAKVISVRSCMDGNFADAPFPMYAFPDPGSKPYDGHRTLMRHRAVRTSCDAAREPG